MSLEQKATVFFIIFWLSLFIPLGWFRVIFLIICCWYYKKILTPLLLLILFLASIRITYTELKPKVINSPFCGKVANFSDNYILLKNKNYQVAIFDELKVNYNDSLCVEGTLVPIKKKHNFFSDPITQWQITSNHVGSITPSRLTKVNTKSSLKGKLYDYLQDKKHTQWIVTLLFNKKVTSNSVIIPLLFSSGLQFSYAIRFIKKQLNKYVIQSHAAIAISILWIWFYFVFGSTFVWWRVFFMVIGLQYLPNKKIGLVVGYGILLLIYPTMYKHISFVLPMILQMTFYHQKPTLVKRWIMIAFLQHMLFYSSNAILIVAFSLLRHVSGLAYLLAWLSVVLPFIRQPFNAFMDFLLTFSMPSWAILTGKIPFFIGLLMIGFLLANRQQKGRTYTQLGIVMLLFIGLWRFPPFDLVLFFNVQQGDAALIRSKYSQDTIMIDVGRASNAGHLATSLKAIGVTHLDSVLLSHQDDDHAGGIEALKQSMPIDHVQTDKKDYRFKAFDFIGLNQNYQGVDDNDNSMMGIVAFDNFTYLFTGDVYKRGEIYLTKEYPNLTVDVLKVAHHGSKTSTSKQLLATTKARIGIISSDPSVYNHPHDDVLQRLHHFQVLPLLTHIEGDIAFIHAFNRQFVLTSQGRFAIIEAVIQ